MDRVVIDTNVVLDNPEVLLSDDIQIVLPYVVLQELDKLKRNPDLNMTARMGIKAVKEGLKSGKIEIVGLPTDNQTNDEIIVETAKEQKAKLWTSDVGASVIGLHRGVEEYITTASDYDPNYKGYSYHRVESDVFYSVFNMHDTLMASEVELIIKEEMLQNHYIFVYPDDKSNNHRIFWKHGEGYELVVEGNKLYRGISQKGSRGLDFQFLHEEQAMAFHAVWNTQTPLAVIQGKIGCVDEETEYLTKSGWKKIKDYDINNPEDIAIVDKDMQVIWEKPLDYVHNLGEFKAFQYHNHEGIDMVLTPDHRIVYSETGWVADTRVGVEEDLKHLKGIFIFSVDPIPTTQNSPYVIERYFMTSEDFQKRKEVTIQDSYCFTTSTSFWLARRGNFVFVTGNSGKTLVSTIAAMSRVAGNKTHRKYNKILVTRPNRPISKDYEIGFLKGDESEKLHPWLSGFTSNLEFLFEKNLEDVENQVAQSVFNGYFKPVSIASVQGASFHNSILLIDEGQLLDVNALKQLLSRIADTSKVVVILDPAQTYGANRGREGFKKLLPICKDNPLISYISLQHTQRSPLTSLVKDML